MDQVALVDFARALIDIDSTTGREGDVARVLATRLRALGYTVVEQPVDGDRINLVATIDAPVVVFSTHFDCVPPFFPSRIEGGRLYGRGSCDAKGILATQVAAAERLRAAGERRVGLLFVAGEERGSDGAKVANTLETTSKYLVNGEPTDNRLAQATRGVYRVRINATGTAAHSSRPDLGVSAIDKLIDALVAMREVEWPSDRVLGQTFYSIGLIEGGVAPNVISPSASAEILFRSVGDHETLLQLTREAVGGLADVEEVLAVPAVKLKTIYGFETETFAFTTDIPFLDRWGTPLLLGPGSVELAHTADESVGIQELADAVELYERLARALLARVDERAAALDVERSARAAAKAALDAAGGAEDAEAFTELLYAEQPDWSHLPLVDTGGRVIDYVKLAAALARRFAAVVPAGVTVRAEGQAIHFHMKDAVYLQMGSGAYVQDLNPGRQTIESAVDNNVRNALSDLQDFIQEASTEAWPVAFGPDDRRRLVMPDCFIADRVVRMSFEDVLVLEDLPLSEIVT